MERIFAEHLFDGYYDGRIEVKKVLDSMLEIDVKAKYYYRCDANEKVCLLVGIDIPQNSYISENFVFKVEEEYFRALWTSDLKYFEEAKSKDLEIQLSLF